MQYGGHLHFVFSLCDVTIWRHIHVTKLPFWRSLLTWYAYFSTRTPLYLCVMALNIKKWAYSPKISYDKKAEENKKYIYCTNKHLLILKIILTAVDLCINASILKWIICKHNFSLPLLTSNVPFQIGKSTPRGTCIPGCHPLVWYYLRLGFKAGVTKLLPQTQSYFLVQIHANSGVRRKFSWGCLVQGHMVVICFWCALFVTSQFDVISMFWRSLLT